MLTSSFQCSCTQFQKPLKDEKHTLLYMKASLDIFVIDYIPQEICLTVLPTCGIIFVLYQSLWEQFFFNCMLGYISMSVQVHKKKLEIWAYEYMLFKVLLRSTQRNVRKDLRGLWESAPCNDAQGVPGMKS